MKVKNENIKNDIGIRIQKLFVLLSFFDYASNYKSLLQMMWTPQQSLHCSFPFIGVFCPVDKERLKLYKFSRWLV